jgi:hypothetical protein
VDNGKNGIWVWIGKKSSPKERTEAMRNALVCFILISLVIFYIFYPKRVSYKQKDLKKKFKIQLKSLELLMEVSQLNLKLYSIVGMN